MLAALELSMERQRHPEHGCLLFPLLEVERRHIFNLREAKGKYMSVHRLLCKDQATAHCKVSMETWFECIV